MPEMEPADGPYSLENEQQFWSELEKILSEQCDTHAVIDNVLRSYLSFCVQFKEDFLVNEYDISRCSYKLFSSSLFTQHADYIRRQIIYSLLQEDDPIPLHFIVSFLLFDGRQNVSTFQLMNEQLTNEASSFARLLELIYSTDSRNGDNAGLHRMLMDLLYEMSRIQRIKIEDLVFIDDDFVRYLFDIIEGLSDDAQDPYHYTVIRVLLVLNEQFMVQSHHPDAGTSSNTLTNKIMKVLSMHGNIYKTFGENIILLLNREGETSLQLLTLKLLYLIFTTPTTYEYFYTNDLRVLVDILIRNLLDLPEEAIALRHTYLRVFYPLLAHTQLKYHPHYKREEIRRTLSILVHSRIEGNESDCERIMHFSEADDTTKRLVSRCSQVEWLYDRENEHHSKIPDSPEEDGPKDITGISISDLHGTNPGILSDSSITQSTDAAATSRDKIEVASTVNPPSVKKAISDMHNTPSNVSAHISAEGQDPVIPAIQSVDFTDVSNRVTTRQKPQLPKPRRPKGSHVSVESTDTRGRSALLSENRHPSALKVSPKSSSETLPVPKNASTSRSTSRPAPAVPPPRRSLNHVSQSAMTSENHSSHPPLSTKTSVRPQPPRTRRWQHGAKLSTETLGTEDERSASPASVSSSFHAKEANDENQSCDSTASIKQALERTNLEA